MGVVGMAGLIALCGGLVLADDKKEKEENNVVERHTGVAFPKNLKCNVNGEEVVFQLVNVGVRTITFLRFNTYSLAFYLPENGNPAVKKLCPYASADPKTLYKYFSLIG